MAAPRKHAGDKLPQELSPLGRLISDVMAENGWSYADAGRACGLPRSTVHGLVHTMRTTRMLNRPATLEGLARGLGVPLDVVRAAAAATAGVDIEYRDDPLVSPEQRAVAERLARLTPAERKRVVAMLDAMYPDEPATPKKARKTSS